MKKILFLFIFTFLIVSNLEGSNILDKQFFNIKPAYLSGLNFVEREGKENLIFLYEGFFDPYHKTKITLWSKSTGIKIQELKGHFQCGFLDMPKAWIFYGIELGKEGNTVKVNELTEKLTFKNERNLLKDTHTSHFDKLIYNKGKYYLVGDIKKARWENPLEVVKFIISGGHGAYEEKLRVVQIKGKKIITDKCLDQRAPVNTNIGEIISHLKNDKIYFAWTEGIDFKSSPPKFKTCEYSLNTNEFTEVTDLTNILKNKNLNFISSGLFSMSFKGDNTYYALPYWDGDKSKRGIIVLKKSPDKSEILKKIEVHGYCPKIIIKKNKIYLFWFTKNGISFITKKNNKWSIPKKIINDYIGKDEPLFNIRTYDVLLDQENNFHLLYLTKKGAVYEKIKTKEEI